LVLDADKIVAQSHIRRVRMLNELSPEYVMVFLNTKYGQYQVKKRTVVQATIPTIGDGLKQIEIPIIPEETEKEIVRLVKQASKLKSDKKLLIRKAKKSIESVLLENN
jgi:type I restriction enzyme S subunit